MLMEMLSGQSAMMEVERLREENRRLWNELHEARRRADSLEVRLQHALENADVIAARNKLREARDPS